MMKPVATFFKSFRWYDWTMLAAIVVFATILILQRMDSKLLPEFLRRKPAEALETEGGDTKKPPAAASGDTSNPHKEPGIQDESEAGSTMAESEGAEQGGGPGAGAKPEKPYMYGNYGGHGMYKGKYRDMDYDM